MGQRLLSFILTNKFICCSFSFHPITLTCLLDSQVSYNCTMSSTVKSVVALMDNFKNAEASLHSDSSRITDTIIKEVQKEEGKYCL